MDNNFLSVADLAISSGFLNWGPEYNFFVLDYIQERKKAK